MEAYYARHKYALTEVSRIVSQDVVDFLIQLQLNRNIKISKMNNQRTYSPQFKTVDILPRI